MKFNDLYKRLILENVDELKSEMDSLEDAIVRNRQGMVMYSDRVVLNQARKVANLLITKNIDFNTFLSLFPSYSDYSKSLVETSFDKLKEKSKLQSSLSQIDSWWSMFEPLLKTLEETLRENLTKAMREIQNEIGTESLKSFLFKTSKHREDAEKMKQELNDLRIKAKNPEYIQTLNDFQKKDFLNKMSIMPSIIHRTEGEIYTKHPLYWLTRYIPKGGIVEPEYSEIIEKVIKDSIEKNKEKLKISVAKAIKDENVTDVKEKSIRIGDLGFEGDFELTFDNGSKRTLRTQAVGAGGYNIQSFHYRYLCKLLK